jgi:ketosteroid isomerase-like protein
MSLSDNDVKTIKQIYEQMIQSFLAGDWRGNAAHYADDAIFLSPEGEMFQARGQQSIADWSADMVNSSGVEQVTIADNVEILDGDDSCAYLYVPVARETIQFAGTHETREFRLNTVLIFKKHSNGVWKIKLQTWNKYLVQTKDNN